MHQPRVQKLPYLLSLALLGLIFGSYLGMSESAIAATETSPLPAITSANAADDLLPPEQAFAISARFRDAKTIELNYKIADGYYMYRKRFRVASESPTFKIAKIVTPPGSVKQDATFGRVETYRKSVRVLLPTTRLSRAVVGSDEVIKVAVISQGCADVGVCYPPYRHDLTLVVGSGDTVVPVLAENPSAAAISTPTGGKPPSIADMFIKKAP
jgi:thioredoxin:protein disulfide reductase